MAGVSLQPAPTKPFIPPMKIFSIIRKISIDNQLLSSVYMMIMKAQKIKSNGNGLLRPVMVRMEKALYDELAFRADRNHRKLAQQIRVILWEFVGKVPR